MSDPNALDGPRQPTSFVCVWSPGGVQAAVVRVSGVLDRVTAPRVEQVLDEAFEHARLVMVNVRELACVDDSGLYVLLDAAGRARKGGSRLVLVGVPEELARWFTVTGTRTQIDMLPDTPAPAGGSHDAVSMTRDMAAALAGTRSDGPIVDGGFDPLLNPVNARIVEARAMDISDRALWAHSSDGTIRRGWAPAAGGVRVPPGAPLELYLDHRGTINGWWHTASRVAVNQRHLTSLDDEQVAAAGLACQGACELIWQAPAAAHVLEHNERCLTCAGSLVLV